MLKNFPGSVQNLPPQENAPRLEKIISEIPDFMERREEILGKKRLVIFSIGLENCSGCTIQEHALTELEKHSLQQQSAVVLEVTVAHP